MRILELNFEKSWRGGERQTLYNMQGFRKAGISTELVCRKNAALEARAAADGFTVHSFGSVAGVIFFLLRQAKNYDCIHAQTSHILTYCILTRWIHRRKIIFTRRVNFTPKGFFTKLKYNAANAIVAISHEVKKTVENFCGRKGVAVISDIVVPQTPDEKRAANIVGDYMSAGKIIIGTTAAFTSEKDPVTMVESIKKLLALRQDFVFLHFGDGPMLQDIQTMINEYGLQDVYRLMGFSKHVADVLPFFKVFVLTSIEEGLGSSVLDAFINKVPVVSTDAGGLKELLQHERGIACATSDSAAIANGIHTFLYNSDKRETCVQNAWQYVQQYHSMDYITQQYIHLIHQ